MMAQLSGYGGNGNMSTAALTAEQRSRERQRLRRQGTEKAEELPSFSEPRKIAVGRQDSLSNNIQNVLGDVHAFHRVIEKSPSVLYGTSRTGSKNFQGSKTNKDGSLNKSHLSSSVRASHLSASHSSSSRSNSVHSQKSSEQSSLLSSNSAGSFMHSNSSSSAFNATNSTTGSAGKPSSNKHSDTSVTAAPRVTHGKPAPISNRSRLQSMDMPAAMDSIFREMRMNEVEPITAIQTPQIGQEFNFPKNELKSKSSVESSQHEDERNSEAHPNSDSDSSDEDDDTDSDDSDEEKNEGWNLTEFMTGFQQSNKNPTSHQPESTQKKQKAFDKEEFATNNRNATTRVQAVEESSSHKDASPRRDARVSGATSSIVKEEKKPEKRPRGRPPGPRSTAHKVTSTQPLPPQHSNPTPKKSKPSSQPVSNSRESNRVESNTKQVQSKSMQKQAASSSRDVKQAIKMNTVRSHDVHPPSAISSPPPRSPPFSIKNETLSPDAPVSSERHRTAKKSPRLIYAPTYTSSESSDEDGTSSSSSDSEEDSSPPAKTHQFIPVPVTEQRIKHAVAKTNKQGASTSTNQKSSLSNDQSDVRNSSHKNPDHHSRHKKYKEEKKARPPSNHSKSSSTSRSLLSQTIHKTQVEKSSNTNNRNYIKDTKPPRVASPISQPEKPAASLKKFPSLWAKLPTLSSKSSTPPDGNRILCNDKNEQNRVTNKPGVRTLNDRLLQTSRCDSTGFSVSTENFSDQQADDIQVANSLSSSSVSPNQQRHPAKRKLPKAPSHSNKTKRRKSQSSPVPQNANNASSQTMSMQGAKQVRKEAEQWKDRKDVPYSSGRYWPDMPSNQQAPSASNKKSTSNIELQPRNPHPNQVASLQEPDSSWPEQETRFKTSEQFMREGKRLKHEGDSYTDTKTGRTRNGESLSRALLYFEASLCFLMNGFMLEVENNNDRSDSSRATHSPTSMYNQTISLLDYIRKMRPHDEREETAFQRLDISCLRTQALLYLRVFKLKKEVASKYHDTIGDHFKVNSNKSNHIPSPWHPAGQNALSPVSPAVPSPYGSNMPGPSPLAVSTACEQVSSSTQVGKMTSPPAQSGILLPPKIHEMFKQYHTIMGSVMQAHEKWDQAEALMLDHTDFFRHVDVLRGHSLNLDNSVKDVETYNKVILRQLRGSYKSPKD